MVWNALLYLYIGSKSRRQGTQTFPQSRHILGFPNFTGRDKLRVDLAKKLVDFMYDLCLRCLKTRIIFYIESPRSNLFRAMPQMQLLATLP